MPQGSGGTYKVGAKATRWSRAQWEKNSVRQRERGVLVQKAVPLTRSASSEVMIQCREGEREVGEIAGRRRHAALGARRARRRLGVALRSLWRGPWRWAFRPKGAAAGGAAACPTALSGRKVGRHSQHRITLLAHALQSRLEVFRRRRVVGLRHGVPGKWRGVRRWPRRPCMRARRTRAGAQPRQGHGGADRHALGREQRWRRGHSRGRYAWGPLLAPPNRPHRPHGLPGMRQGRAAHRLLVACRRGP
mmetsp:Transcript_122945/g.353158  ORF Transcript_122945/g.353158 Transcript_122945/m.353158 type:complete len:248 (-) Transcript_122945:1570-2313(-)